MGDYSSMSSTDEVRVGLPKKWPVWKLSGRLIRYSTKHLTSEVGPHNAFLPSSARRGSSKTNLYFIDEVQSSASLRSRILQHELHLPVEAAELVRVCDLVPSSNLFRHQPRVARDTTGLCVKPANQTES